MSRPNLPAETLEPAPEKASLPAGSDVRSCGPSTIPRRWDEALGELNRKSSSARGIPGSRWELRAKCRRNIRLPEVETEAADPDPLRISEVGLPRQTARRRWIGRSGRGGG